MIHDVRLLPALTDGAQMSDAFAQLIVELPAAHQSALRVIMEHVTRLLQHQNKYWRENATLSMLSQVFYHFFMRPPWCDIM